MNKLASIATQLAFQIQTIKKIEEISVNSSKATDLQKLLLEEVVTDIKFQLKNLLRCVRITAAFSVWNRRTISLAESQTAALAKKEYFEMSGISKSIDENDLTKHLKGLRPDLFLVIGELYNIMEIPRFANEEIVKFLDLMIDNFFIHSGDNWDVLIDGLNKLDSLIEK